MEQSSKLRIGFSGNPKYLDEFLQLVKADGHSFAVIDFSKPISEQGPFDVIMQKIVAGEKGRKMVEALISYQQQNPKCVILDPPSAVRLLVDRLPTIQKLETLSVAQSPHAVFHPVSFAFTEGESLPASSFFPLIAKPLLADGSPESHEIAIVYNHQGIKEVMRHLKSSTIIIQQFINHDAFLHKIYCIGDQVFMGARPSLPNMTEAQIKEKEQSGVNFEFFGRISRNESKEHRTDVLPVPPPIELVQKTCQDIRKRLGINLFGVDVITKCRADTHNTSGIEHEHYVIDVNYFPSYTGMKSASDLIFRFVLEAKGLSTRKGSGA